VCLIESSFRDDKQMTWRWQLELERLDEMSDKRQCRNQRVTSDYGRTINITTVRSSIMEELTGVWCGVFGDKSLVGHQAFFYEVEKSKKPLADKGVSQGW
jgi:hypothetical protein